MKDILSELEMLLQDEKALLEEIDDEEKHLSKLKGYLQECRDAIAKEKQ